MSSKKELTPEGVLADIGYRGFVERLFSRSNPPDMSKDMAHAILGIVTELNELKNASEYINSVEELGDLDFYTVELVSLIEETLGESVEDTVTVNYMDQIDSMFEGLHDGYGPWDLIDDARTELLDVAKRWVGYGRAPKDLRQLALDAVCLNYFAMTQCRFPEPDSTKVRLTNIAKLLERYKGLAFNADHAVNRDTGKEREVLETYAA